MIQNKKAISGVITAVILVALVFALVAIVWVVVNNMIKGELEGVESCFGIFGEVTINNRYTCYNPVSDQFQFSISIGDINVNEVLVSISGGGTTKSFQISNATSAIENLRTYPDGSPETKLPGKNSGLTYIYDMAGAGFSNTPDSIEIAPVVNRKQCEVSDSLSEIDDCSSLA